MAILAVKVAVTEFLVFQQRECCSWIQFRDGLTAWNSWATRDRHCHSRAHVGPDREANNRGSK
jgi:hypothetical protein